LPAQSEWQTRQSRFTVEQIVAILRETDRDRVAAVLQLEGNSSGCLTTIPLPLTVTGRPKPPLVLSNSRPKG